MKKVLVYGAYDMDNLGDDYMMYQVDQKLRNNNISPVYRTFSSKTNYFNVNESETLEFPKDKNKLILALKTVKWLFTSKDIKDIDALICMGGGYTNEKFGIQNLLRLYFTIIKFKRNNKKIYFTGQTVGPAKKGIYLSLIKKIYKSANKIFVREIYSQKFLVDNKIDCELAGDDAFLTLINNDSEKTDEKDNSIIVNYKEFGNNDEYKNKYFDFLRSISTKMGYKVIIIPFRSSEKTKEYKINYELYEYLKTNGINAEFKVERNINSFESIFKKSKITIGTAYHSVVLGLIFNNTAYTAYLDEYYKIKMNGILNWYEYSETNCINLKDILNGKFEDMILNNNFDMEKQFCISKKIADNVSKAWDKIIRDIEE